ncbi:glucokinase [Marinobacter lutaoensis]|jgi:glucokinase|uniref:Glucokinase n=1 Tax=Marinobacter lutaoensis TaxID=135739 RepID=A0A1V2DR96_9GAMM|nr:glucokinase [Marinobacter lutaoensis]MBE02804.1 glucokinase [Marinobacter sp.]MBI44298.1 glucokinase [Oceanospirillales bacterium]ONF43039.1 glucokinase [Marinobacter lutaoensis]|tara:strand:- start:381 stop:1346 length:966 start_codon:yes stop_codon:yes gene_type:complete
MTTESYSLVGDIGGTNARFALVRQGQVRPEAIRVLPCGDYDNLDQAVAEYLAGAGVASVEQVCLAVASPVRGTEVRMTNNHWRFDIEAVRRQFGWSVFKVINDFAAMALGVLHVAEDQRVHVCGGPGDPTRPRLVMGPGTGLGVSGLVPTRSGWVPLMTEGGHVDFAPTDEREMAVLRILRNRFGRVSVERILCGQGLLNLYQALAEIQGVSAPLDAPEKITAAAVANRDRLAREALGHFCEILGRTAGNGVLTLGSLGGVYLCGGILPRFLDFFLESRFRNGFEDKGRMRPLLEFTPVYLITDPYTGLLGAAEALNNVEV